ncbi:hypothetical protein FOA52_003967 [Chlamydomonas sp. UWO 241]|nr:hypothetical protein FOA52_003967 [Chlamydomonas sp. UWO 241]
MARQGLHRCAARVLLLVLLALLEHVPVLSLDVSGGRRSTQGERDPKAWGDLKIYIYEGPEKWRNFSAWGDISDSDYGLDQLFPALLKMSAYVTTDPDEADYFVLDAWLFWPDASRSFDEVHEWLSAAGPWWARTEGRDHVFVLTADLARCEYNHGSGHARHGAPNAYMANSIMLHHYGAGLHSKENWCSQDYVRTRWMGGMDPASLLANSLRSKHRCGASDSHSDANGLACLPSQRGERLPRLCHIPYQDIVVPPPKFERQAVQECRQCHYSKEPSKSWKIPYVPEHDVPHGSRNGSMLLFQATPGHFWYEAWYSVGARQNVAMMWGEPMGQIPEPGMEMWVNVGADRGGQYWDMVHEAVFCLASTGTGWGSRFKVMLTHGCLPLLASDGIRAEWEEQIDLRHYAVRLPLSAAYKAPQLIRKWLADGTVAKMQANLECAWRLHWWRRPHGRAFEVTMCELRRRKARVPRGTKMHVDFKACTLTCIPGEEPIQLR